METVQALVAAGVGISMAPAMARESGARVGYRSLGNPKPTRTVALVWNKRRHLTRAALELRDHIVSNCSGRP
jgi:DNA-binding transcriptional LysR family regulator